RPTSDEVLKRWRTVRGRQGHPADPEFAGYLRATLDTLVLDGNKLPMFQQLLGHLARLIAGNGRAADVASRAHALSCELESARLVDRTWEAARMMVDRRSGQERFSAARTLELHTLGLRRAVDHALVGLALSRKGEGSSVDHLIQ